MLPFTKPLQTCTKIEPTRALSALVIVGLSLDPEGRKMVLGDKRLPVLFLTVLIPPESIFPSFTPYVAALKNPPFLKT